MDECCICMGEGWVCEQHPQLPWPHDLCDGPGMPCRCNPTAALPDNFTVIAGSVEHNRG